MSIYGCAQILVGLPAGEIINQELITDEELDTEMEMCNITDGREDSSTEVFGFLYAEAYGSKTELEYDDAEVQKLKNRFKKETGQDAKVWLIPSIG